MATLNRAALANQRGVYPFKAINGLE